MGGGVSGFQNTQLSSFQNSDYSHARQGLQRPEVMSLEAAARKTQPGRKGCSRGPGQACDRQALCNRSTSKEKRESSGRTLVTAVRSPAPSASTCRDRSLCPENVPLKGVTVHLTKRLSRGSPTGAMWGALLHPQDTSPQAGQEMTVMVATLL